MYVNICLWLPSEFSMTQTVIRVRLSPSRPLSDAGKGILNSGHSPENPLELNSQVSKSARPGAPGTLLERRAKQNCQPSFKAGS